MKYDITDTSQPLVEKYPELKEYPEFSGNDLHLRFVIAFCDISDKESDLSKRISQSAKKAGLTPDDAILENKEVEAMMCRYFIMLNNETYELWLSKKIAFGEANHRMRVPVTDAKDPIKSMEVKMKISDLTEKLRTDIMKLERTLFKDPVIENKIKESTSSRVIHYAEMFAEEKQY